MHRIQTTKDFAIVCKGDLGGFVESENNLSHEGDAWVWGDAQVYGDALITGHARILDKTEVCGV